MEDRFVGFDRHAKRVRWVTIENEEKWVMAIFKSDSRVVTITKNGKEVWKR